jgi:hypothetical protein
MRMLAVLAAGLLLLELSSMSSSASTTVLQQGGAIAGRVRDPEGKPILDATVMAFTRGTTGPERLPVAAPTAARAALTDDRGVFRVFGLSSGEYLLLARHSNPHGLLERERPVVRTILAPTFYPGTQDLAAAQTVKVIAGQTAGDIEIKLMRTVGWVVVGIVSSAQHGAVYRAVVTMVAWPTLTPDRALSGAIASPDLSPDRWVASAVSGRDGHFSISEVPAGQYKLVASAPLTGAGASAPQVSTRLAVEKDVTDLKLTLP